MSLQPPRLFMAIFAFDVKHNLAKSSYEQFFVDRHLITPIRSGTLILLLYKKAFVLLFSILILLLYKKAFVLLFSILICLKEAKEHNKCIVLHSQVTDCNCFH